MTTRTKKPRRWRPTYGLLDRLMASPTEPMPTERARNQLTNMHLALGEIERGFEPTAGDWRQLADAVNLMETFVEMGIAIDTSGLLRQAVAALAIAGARHLQDGQPLRLTGAGIQAVRAILADYTMCLEELPERVIVEAHRQTEIRVRAVLEGRARPEDICIVETER